MAKNKKVDKAKARDKYLQRTYGITLADYVTMLANQGNACAICKRDQSRFKNSLAVDHNHKTGKTRGLLCFYCNKRIVGRHTIESVESIYKYLLTYDSWEYSPFRERAFFSL